MKIPDKTKAPTTKANEETEHPVTFLTVLRNLELLVDLEPYKHDPALDEIPKDAQQTHSKYMDWAKALPTHELQEYATAIMSTLCSRGMQTDLLRSNRPSLAAAKELIGQPRGTYTIEPDGTLKPSCAIILGRIAQINLEALRSMALKGHDASAYQIYAVLHGAIEGLNYDVLKLKDNNFSTFSSHDIADLPTFVDKLSKNIDEFSQFLKSRIDPAIDSLLKTYISKTNKAKKLQSFLAKELNQIIASPDFAKKAPLQNVKLRPETIKLQKTNPSGQKLQQLGRMLLEDAYPRALLRNRNIHREVAEASPNWPTLYSPNSSLSSDTKTLHEVLGIGSRHIVDLKPNPKGKLWSIETPANELAMRIIHIFSALSYEAHFNDFQNITRKFKLIKNVVPPWIMEFKKLPIFPDSSGERPDPAMKKWADIAWKLILEVTDGTPETDLDLRPIGTACDFRKLDTEQKALPDSRLRAKIKEELTGAFCNLAPFSASASQHEHYRRYALAHGRYLEKLSETNKTLFFSERWRIIDYARDQKKIEGINWILLENCFTYAFEMNIPPAELYPLFTRLIDGFEKDTDLPDAPGGV